MKPPTRVTTTEGARKLCTRVITTEGARKSHTRVIITEGHRKNPTRVLTTEGASKPVIGVITKMQNFRIITLKTNIRLLPKIRMYSNVDLLQC
jgi:hypothetical protein